MVGHVLAVAVMQGALWCLARLLRLLLTNVAKPLAFAAFFFSLVHSRSPSTGGSRPLLGAMPATARSFGALS